ncbi:diguanylate cyclase [Pseudoxanthomonas sp. JBR18]|uniref:diguanylate cyclase domain-containing protein n=1 Tax=Pseudoxanthomonas sp. JBR18 TaxID=2969308 RepID=UPI0023069526|nr:diguanylate cyclase [Pseudoxanthomonas sp. JBR18]WCE04389.1 diguanylate cyclase [Pseudoxanthomonas sp. JBR18]
MNRLGAVLVGLLCCAMATAQAATGTGTPARALDLADLESPAFTNFTTTDGLPDAGVLSIAVDREGFVWGASGAGIYRYDGRRWSASPDPAVAHPATSVFVDRTGRLWAAFRNTGLAFYDGQQWHAKTTANGLPSNQIHRFAETVDASGTVTLWALTWDRGLMRLASEHWELDPGNASLPADPLRSLAQTRQLGAPGRQWLGTNARGLWYRDSGQTDWRPWEGHQLDANQVEDLLPVMQDGHEALWISTYTGGLWRMRADDMRHWSAKTGDFPSKIVYTIASTAMSDGSRAIWVSSRAGLLRVHGDTFQLFDRRDGLRSNLVRDVVAWHTPDGLDVLWMATDDGVARTVLGANPWAVASRMGADALGVFGFLVEPDGKGGERLWVSSSGEGLALYQDQRWHRFTTEEGVPPDANIGSVMRTLDAEGRSTHWVSLRGGALLRRGPAAQRFEPMTTPWRQTTGEMVYDTLVRPFEGSREQWFATRETGLYRLREDRWTHYPSPDPRVPWRAMRIREVIDAHGRAWLWAATSQGLARFDGDRWTVMSHDIGMPETNTIGMTLIPDRHGRQILWVGTSSAGVTRVDVSVPLAPRVLPNDLPPPPDPSIYNPAPDSAGRVYLCTNNGVQLLTPDGDGYTSRVFTRHDGLLHQECNYVHTVDAHDRFWAGTLGGLEVYDPRRELHDTQPKRLKLTGLAVDGTPAEGRPLRVPADAREIRVDFALLSWFREADSRFRTQLLGYESAPTAWSEQNFRTFNALPPGRYRLRIEAHDHADNPSVPVELPIVIAAAWWQTQWTVAAAAMLLAALIYALVRWRTYHLRARQSVLEQHVAERTAELHAANARLHALSYRDELTGLDNRRRLLEVLAPPAEGSQPSSLILLDVDHFKAFNDRHGHPAGDEALRRVAEALRTCIPSDAHVARHGGEEFACVLPEADLPRALRVAECIRAAVAACPIPVPGHSAPRHVTISAGVAALEITTREDMLRLFNDADLALYQAKAQGRDRVQAYVTP